MAEQLLQRAQIRAAPKQMRSEAVAQGMGGGAVGQAEPGSCRLHRAADQRGIERAPLAPRNSASLRSIGQGHSAA